ncbi:MAG: hydantoinase/oxoprolinase family protein [Chloroflexota bacterium]|nr:hydantoinase/oxoprolinase family protein [Chloroflexota bacterium]
MAITLGIDTGGTYTDAVLVDYTSGAVLSSAKSLTTHHDLSVGIGRAVAAACDGQTASPAEVSLVALSTTLATNAIVEGQGSPVCLLLIGYDPALIRQYGFEHDLVTPNVVYLRGGHDGAGNEVEPLDETAAREAILAWRDRVDAFAVSGYFGVRNPAHERRVRALVEELTGLPVACGHELTTRLNAVRRATTAALNARLIPLLQELIITVRRTLQGLNIAAPLMVVKGDGSLVRAEWAKQRPIETILSGPAASVVGAWHLAGRSDVWVVDVGGTTTDIATLRDGRPRLNPEGAQVGEWQTMIKAADVHTVGLGGDSHVQLDKGGHLIIGPRRVVPLCLLASEHPTILDELRRQVTSRQRKSLAGQFVLAQCRMTRTTSDDDRRLLRHLATGPQSLVSLVDRLRYGSLVVQRIEGLEARRLVLRAGFTPTDALHALGRFECWDAKASRLGAELLAARVDLSSKVLCERVVSGVSNRVTTELVSKVLSDEATPPDWEREPAATALLNRALGNGPESDMDCQFRLCQPVVAVGAPVEAYMHRVAEQMHTALIIPSHAEVANAVGAVAGSVVQQLRATVRPLSAGQCFRLHLPDGVRDFSTVEEAVMHARQVLPVKLKALARQAGADHVEVQVVRVDKDAPVATGWGQQVYLGTELTFTAVGRPSLA